MTNDDLHIERNEKARRFSGPMLDTKYIAAENVYFGKLKSHILFSFPLEYE